MDDKLFQFKLRFYHLINKYVALTLTSLVVKSILLHNPIEMQIYKLGGGKTANDTDRV